MSTNTDPPPMNHVFVDFENVQKIDLSVIGSKSVHFTILLGPKQTKLGTDLVEKLIEHANCVKMIRLESSGKNALDFAIAYYVGRTAVAYPGSYIHIVSKDTGFDPLVEHLKKRQIRVYRHDSFATLTFSASAAKAKTSPPDDPSVRALEHLKKIGKSRPKTKNSLLSNLKDILGKDTTEAEVAKLVEALRMAKHLSISDKDAVTYHL